MHLKEKKITDKEKELISKLYREIYKNFSNYQVDVFLCGGDVTKDTDRRKLNEYLKNEKDIMIFYPEHIFVEYFNINQKSDYLTLEKLLAENVDFICIVCESPGAIAELGAFSANKSIMHKIFALLKKDFEKDESFINLGPVRHLLKNDKNSVQYYNSDNFEKICTKFKTKIKRYLKEAPEIKTINHITGMFYFISLLLYIFKELQRDFIFSYVKFIYSSIEKNRRISQIKPIYYAAEKLLFNKGIIKVKNRDSLELTLLGYSFISNLLNKNRNYCYDNIICDIMRYKYYKY